MNPWITGRIIESMQHDSRSRADEARLGRIATRPAPHAVRAPISEPEPPRRERFGLAVARLGLRIAGDCQLRIARARSTNQPAVPSHS
jgi:hypothetical protein